MTNVIVDAESMSYIDSSGALGLTELLDALDERDIAMSMARVRTEIEDELSKADIRSRLAGEGLYLEVDDAVVAALDSRSVD